MKSCKPITTRNSQAAAPRHYPSVRRAAQEHPVAEVLIGATNPLDSRLSDLEWLLLWTQMFSEDTGSQRH